MPSSQTAPQHSPRRDAAGEGAPARPPGDGDVTLRRFRWAGELIAVAGVGKSLIEQPRVALLVVGAGYSLVLWFALRAARMSRATLALALALLFATIMTSHNEALIAFAPLVPLTAVSLEIPAAVVVVVATVAWSGVVSVALGDDASSTIQILLSMAGSSLFLLEFSRLLLRERDDVRALAMQATQIAELSAKVERQRVAQAIHDGVGHFLSAAVVQLEVARVERAEAPERATASLERARSLVVAGMQEVRTAVAALRDEVPSSFRRALDELVEASNEAGVVTRLVREGPERRLAPEVAWAVFSTVQESLTNVRKHAAATRADVHLRYLDAAVELTIEDDGRGVAEPAEGNGLRAIRERAAAFGGEVRVSTGPGRGFSLVWRISA